MTKLKGVEIGILATASMRDKDSGRRFLQLLGSMALRYAPERYDDHEPIKLPFDPENLDRALECWGRSFLWRGTPSSIVGGAYVGFHEVHDGVVLRMPASALDMKSVRRLFEAMGQTFGIDLAFVHVRTDADTTDIEYYKRHLMPFQTLNTHHLREGLPDLPWAMLFGPPYVKLFGRERLMSSTAACVEVVGNGVYLQLTDNPTDVAKNREEYLTSQRLTKEHLDRDAFRGQTSADRCNVPEFPQFLH